MREIGDDCEGFALARDLPIGGHVTFRREDFAYFIRKLGEGEFEVSIIDPDGDKETFLSPLGTE